MYVWLIFRVNDEGDVGSIRSDDISGFVPDDVNPAHSLIYSFSHPDNPFISTESATTLMLRLEEHVKTTGEKILKRERTMRAKMYSGK